MLVKYLPKYIPGQPTIIVQNMPQAASVVAANYLYVQAPRDGTVFGSFSRNIVNDALTGQPNVEVDPRRLIWLGATSRPARVCVRWYTAPVKTPADLFTQEFIVGAAGATSSLAILPTVLNKVLGTKFRIVEGYQGMGDAMLAVERGELQGMCASYPQFRVGEQLIHDGKLTFLLRAEEAPIPDIPDVPSIFDYAKTDEQRQLMRFVFPSPNSAGPTYSRPRCRRIASHIMRKAIAEAAHDPELRRRGRQHQDGYDLHAAGAPGAARRQALPDAAGVDRDRQGAAAEREVSRRHVRRELQLRGEY